MFNTTFLLVGQETSLILIAIVFIGLMVFMNFNQKKKQKKMVELNNRISVGDRVKTAGGIFGFVESYNEETNTFIVSTGNTTIEIDRGFVYSMEMLGFQSAKKTETSETAETVEDIETVETVEVETISAEEVFSDESLINDETSEKE